MMASVEIPGGRSRQPHRVVAAALLCLALALPGCNSSPASPSGSASFSVVDLTIGSGDEAAVGRILTVHYTGWLFDQNATDNKGLQFDTSAGTPGFRFAIGVGQVIGGWDVGLLGMRAGGARRLTVPPSLAYGGVRNDRIPPNATLVFDVQLISVETQ